MATKHKFQQWWLQKEIAKTRVQTSVTYISNACKTSALPKGTHLVVNEVDHGVFQHLWGLSQSLHSSGLVGMHLCGGDLHPFWQRLGKHGCPHTLWTCLVQLLVDVWRRIPTFHQVPYVWEKCIYQAGTFPELCLCSHTLLQMSRHKECVW